MSESPHSPEPESKKRKEPEPSCPYRVGEWVWLHRDDRRYDHLACITELRYNPHCDETADVHKWYADLAWPSLTGQATMNDVHILEFEHTSWWVPIHIPGFPFINADNELVWEPPCWRKGRTGEPGTFED